MNKNFDPLNNISRKKKEIDFEESLLISINNNFEHITKRRADNLLKKCLSENLSTLEVLNCMFIDNQIEKHIKYFNFNVKMLSKPRKYVELNWNSENIHELMISKYKVFKFNQADNNEINYRHIDEKRRLILRDENRKFSLK